MATNRPPETRCSSSREAARNGRRLAGRLVLLLGLALLLASSSAAWAGGADGLAKSRRPAPPKISPHPDVRAEATSPRGAVVKYRRAVVRGAKSVKYSKASGTVFPLGTTTVTIVAKNRAGTSRAKFNVVVADTTPPRFSTPADVTTTATGYSGANVTFPPITAVDSVDPNPSITCTPASGSLFPVGTTTVNCSARDAVGNEATTSFKVVVNMFPPPAVDGQYRGTTSQGKAIAFTVTGGGYYVTDASVELSSDCTPPGVFSGTYTPLPGTRFGIPPGGSLTLGPLTGSFADNNIVGTHTTTVTAKFAGSAPVTGTVHSHQSITSPGSYECDTGTVTWTAAIS